MPSFNHRTTFWLLLSGAVVAIVSGCRSRVTWAPGAGRFGRPAVQTGYAPRWVQVAPPNTGVRFSMPNQPRVEAQTELDEDGAQRFETVARSESGFGYFAVFVARWEDGIRGEPLRAIADTARTVFERANLQRENSRRLSVTGYYAREDTGTNEEGAHVSLRQFVGADRVVVAVAAVPQRAESVQVANQFMASIGLSTENALFGQAGERNRDGSWTPVFMPEADFAINMPTAPEIEEDEVFIAEQNRARRRFEARDSWGAYRVYVIGFGEHVPEEAYAEMRALLRLGRDVRPVHSQGYPGRVFVSDEGANRSWVRMFQTHGRIYVVEAIGPRSSVRDRRVATRLARYFDSFRIL